MNILHVKLREGSVVETFLQFLVLFHLPADSEEATDAEAMLVQELHHVCQGQRKALSHLAMSPQVTQRHTEYNTRCFQLMLSVNYNTQTDNTAMFKAVIGEPIRGKSKAEGRSRKGSKPGVQSRAKIAIQNRKSSPKKVSKTVNQ